MALTRPRKGQSCTIRELEQEGRVALFQFIWDHGCWVNQIFHCSAHVYEWS